MLSLTPVVRNLLILNIFFFIVDAYVMPLIGGLALRSFLSPFYSPFQLVSYMFLHGNFGHLFSNMFGLFMFGPLLERVWGSRRFLFFYFFTGIGAGLLFSLINFVEMSQLREAVQTYIQYPTPDGLADFLNRYAHELYQSNLSFLNKFEENPTSQQYIKDSVGFVESIFDRQVNIPMVGASGAIFGILMAFGLLFPNMELFLLFFPFPIKAKYFVMFYGLYELYAGMRNAPSDNVAHFAHLGGMLFAFLLLRYWNSKRNTFY